MSIEIEDLVDAEANGSGQALTIIRPAAASSMLVPQLIADAGENASLRFLDFFTANIRNPNTRAAYAVAVRAFFSWLDAKRVAPLAAVRTHHVSAYVEVLGRRYRAPTVKQHLAAIRMLFDWLIVGQIFAGPNPAAAVRGPKHVVKKGKTSVLDGDEAKKLLDSIDVSTLVGLRDRALIALLVYTFARVSAALHMNVEDYYPQGKRWWVRLHEKGGKQHEMPAHHLLEHFLDAYVTKAGIVADKASPLSARRTIIRRASCRAIRSDVSSFRPRPPSGNVSASRRVDDDDISKAGEKEFKCPVNRGLGRLPFQHYSVPGTGAGNSVHHRPLSFTASRHLGNLARGVELSTDATVQY